MAPAVGLILAQVLRAELVGELIIRRLLSFSKAMAEVAKDTITFPQHDEETFG
jgi:hypothetical protein